MKRSFLHYPIEVGRGEPDTMSHEKDNQKTALRRYLLGSASDGERERLEQALLADEDLYEELLTIEDELIDQYVGGDLSEPEGTGFLQYLNALPDHEMRLDFAQVLRTHSLNSVNEASLTIGGAQGKHGKPSGTRARVPAFLFAAAVLLMMLGGIWIFATISGLRDEVRRIHLELARSGEGEAERIQQALVGVDANAPAAPYPFILTAGTFRSAGATQVLRMPQIPTLVELRLDLGFAEYEAYRAVLHDSQGVEVMSLNRLKALIQENEILVAFSMSSERFITGDYYISLSGITENGEPEPLARYDFRILSE